MLRPLFLLAGALAGLLSGTEAFVVPPSAPSVSCCPTRNKLQLRPPVTTARPQWPRRSFSLQPRCMLPLRGRDGGTSSGSRDWMQDFNSLPPTTRLAMGVMGVWATVSLASLAAQAALFVMLPAVVCLSFGLVALSFQLFFGVLATVFVLTFLGQGLLLTTPLLLFGLGSAALLTSMLTNNKPFMTTESSVVDVEPVIAESLDEVLRKNALQDLSDFDERLGRRR